MFTRSARFYDALYARKDYAGEAERLHARIQRYKRTSGSTLLDVGCGTGAHLVHLRRHYQVEGLDLDERMLAIARQRLPEVTFHQGDMVDFDLGRRFDVVVCLFGSIGYVKTESRLRQALQTMSRHVHPGGLVIVEPWLTPEDYQTGKVDAVFVDEPGLKIARISVSEREGDTSVLRFHYLVGAPDGVEYFTERHELGLFPHAAYRAAFQAAHLDVIFDAEGLTGRGLYIGLRASAG